MHADTRRCLANAVGLVVVNSVTSLGVVLMVRLCRSYRYPIHCRRSHSLPRLSITRPIEVTKLASARSRARLLNGQAAALPRASRPRVSSFASASCARCVL